MERHDGALASAFTDTSPRARARYLERLRATPSVEKLRRALTLSRRARDAVMRAVRESHPNASETELQVEFLRRLYGDEIARRFAAHVAGR